MTSQIREAMEKGEIFHAHRTFGRKRFFFSTEDLEFGFIYFLGHAVHGACAIGEMLYLADQFDERKPDSWISLAVSMSERIEARARRSLKSGHAVSAREGLLRASYYHRLATAMISPRAGPEAWRAHFERSRALFREAAGLFDPAMEYLEIPFEGTVLPGYFLRPDHSGDPRKTLLMIGGGETFAEDLYFYVGPPAMARGYNFMTVDLPGQGGLPLEGAFFRPDTETQMKPVVDYALSRADVDPDRLAAFGISAGGYLVPRAAAFEKRIRACVASSLLYDLDRIFRSAMLQFGDLFKKHDPMAYHIADMIAWRWGARNPLGLIAKNRDFKFDPGLISCPTLILIGEGEYSGSKEAKRQQLTGLGSFQNPRKDLVIAPLNEGGGQHVLGENLGLMSQIVFDWLDEVFA